MKLQIQRILQCLILLFYQYKTLYKIFLYNDRVLFPLVPYLVYPCPVLQSAAYRYQCALCQVVEKPLCGLPKCSNIEKVNFPRSVRSSVLALYCQPEHAECLSRPGRLPCHRIFRWSSLHYYYVHAFLWSPPFVVTALHISHILE